MLKRRFAVPIFMRDDEGYAKTIILIQKAYKKETEDYEVMAKKIIELTSTTAFKVPQMTEYLHDIEIFAAEKDVNLTFPEDLMGYK